MKFLSPDKATKLFDEDPDKIAVHMKDIMRVFKLSEDELHAELVSGRLIATGQAMKDGRTMVFVLGGDLTKWMTLTGRHIQSVN